MEIFFKQGKFKLVRYDEGMDGAKFRKVPQENLLEASKTLRLGEKVIFHLDDPGHVALDKLQHFSSFPTFFLS